jgi:hypothetical protein
MGLDLWFREDVARILASTHETMRASQRAMAPLDPELAATYRQGFADALRAVAVAFGVASPEAYHPPSGTSCAGTIEGSVFSGDACDDSRSRGNGSGPRQRRYPSEH